MPQLNKYYSGISKNKETHLNGIVAESVRDILNENARDKRVLDYLKSQGYTDYDKRMKIIGRIKHDIPNVRLDNNKFLLGLCRMFCEHQLNNEQKISYVDYALKYIHMGNHQDEFDENLNGETPDELHERFREASRQISVNDRQRSDNRQFTDGTSYKIIPINSYKEAAPYGKYTSWCVAHDKSAFESYTRGGNRFYFCLKNGFENIPKDDAGAPLNEWGLSMIAINVDMNGGLTRVTTRYNHDYNGENNPKLETPEQVENVMNVPFYQTFKPYTREELHKMGIIPYDEVQGLIDAGTPLENIFEWVSGFEKGIARVILNDKYNYITKKNKLLSNIWFDGAGNFYNGIANVQLAEKYNFISTKGKLISDIWFDATWDFSGNTAKVFLNNKLNLINKDGKLISDIWFNDMTNLIRIPGMARGDRFAKVVARGKSNFINKEGKLLSDIWFDSIWHFDKGLAIVQLNNMYNIINNRGELLSNIWFDRINSNRDGFNATLNGKDYIIDREGKQTILAEEKRHKKKSTPQEQVGGKVNSGLMIGMAYEGLEEKNSKPDFTIGMENDSNLDYGHVASGSAAPGLNESEDKEFNAKNYGDYFKSIGDYMNSHGLVVKPFPKIVLSHKKQDGLFISTGYYQPWDKTVKLFVDGRHPKDILRSFAHEMVHHAQNLRGDSLEFGENEDVKNCERLEKVESEAYLKGNIFFRKWTEYFKNGEQEMLNENRCEEFLKPEEVDLKGFEPQKHLNPKFWKDSHLDSRVRLALLDIAEDFIKFMGIDWVEPEDIIMTGSLAGYNYNEKYSDVDLHIVVDYEDIDEKKELVDNYLYAQKKLWNEEHKNLMIFGFPVELFVQDSNEPYDKASYSLMRDEWNNKPSKKSVKINSADKKEIRNQVSLYTCAIDKMESVLNNSANNQYKIRQLAKSLDSMARHIKDERKLGLEKSEYSIGNLVFKSLRRNGYLEKLFNLKKNLYDKLHSVN